MKLSYFINSQLIVRLMHELTTLNKTVASGTKLWWRSATVRRYSERRAVGFGGRSKSSFS